MIRDTFGETQEHAFRGYDLVQSLKDRAEIRRDQGERSRMFSAENLVKVPLMRKVLRRILKEHPDLHGRLQDAALLVQNDTKSTTFGFHTDKHAPIEDTVVVLLNRKRHGGEQGGSGLYILGDDRVRPYVKRGNSLRFAGGKDPHISVPGPRGSRQVKASFFFKPR
jgi:hypothetical protein